MFKSADEESNEMAETLERFERFVSLAWPSNIPPRIIPITHDKGTIERLMDKGDVMVFETKDRRLVLGKYVPPVKQRFTYWIHLSQCQVCEPTINRCYAQTSYKARLETIRQLAYVL